MLYVTLKCLLGCLFLFLFVTGGDGRLFLPSNENVPYFSSFQFKSEVIMFVLNFGQIILSNLENLKPQQSTTVKTVFWLKDWTKNNAIHFSHYHPQAIWNEQNLESTFFAQEW